MTNSSLIVVLGPTGSGKSDLALSIAQSFDGEMVNFDSVQVYRGLDIGSAKTPVAMRSGVPLHLTDVISPMEDLTAGAYATLARKCLAEVAFRHKLPVLVGGTGFYLRSLLDGLSPAPARNPDLRARLASLVLRRPNALHRLLRLQNPRSALRIHPNDHQKLIRAIELAAAGPAISREPLTGFHILKVGLNPPRPDLYRRINQRTLTMFDSGLLEETRALLQSGVPAQSKALQTLGYKQAVAVLENGLTRAEAIAEVQTKTRQYAKRQMTWFRCEKQVHWLPGFGDQADIRQSALALVEMALRGLI